MGGSKTVLGSTWLGSLVVLWFEFASFVWARFGVVFGCSWGRFGAFLGSLRCLNRRFVVASLCLWFRCVRCCFVLVFVVSCSLTHLLIYSSTHGPSALSNPARRTARCAIKSAATRRVGACLNSFRPDSAVNGKRRIQTLKGILSAYYVIDV